MSATKTITIDPLDQIVGQLASAQTGSCRILGVAGCHEGAGASFVSQALATAIASRTDGQLLTATVAQLSSWADGTPAAILSACAMKSSPNLFELTSGGRLPQTVHATPAGLRHVTAILSNRFRFLIMDCGAVNTSGSLWPVAQVIHELLLVVAAGETTKAQIAYAQRMIARSGAPLAGCILNKRTYPLPASLYRLLA